MGGRADVDRPVGRQGSRCGVSTNLIQSETCGRGSNDFGKDATEVPEVEGKAVIQMTLH